MQEKVLETRSDGLVTLLIIQCNLRTGRCDAAMHPVWAATVLEMGLPPDATFEPEAVPQILDRLRRTWRISVSGGEMSGRITVTGRPKSDRVKVTTQPDLDRMIRARVGDAARTADDLTQQAKPFIDSVVAEARRRVAAGEDPRVVNADTIRQLQEHARASLGGAAKGCPGG